MTPIEKARLRIKTAEEWIDAINDEGVTYFGELDEAEREYIDASQDFIALWDKQQAAALKARPQVTED